MQIHLPRFLLPPQASTYEESQRARLAHVMLFSAVIGGTATGCANLASGWTVEAAYLFLLAFFAAVGLFLNHRGRVGIASAILCSSLFLVVGIQLYHGAGLRDSAILGYPLLMLASAFLWCRGGLRIATLGSIGSVMWIYELQVQGVQMSQQPDTIYRALVLSFLLVITSAMIGAVRASWLSHLHELQKSYDLTLEGWGKALEYRDGETAGHSRRVSELCPMLARRLGCNEEQISQLKRGAYLHDIGKMAIPDAILLKKGRLTAEESRVMKRHTSFGVELISGIPYLQPVESILSSHHENWDGTGYPLGLKGDAIPLAARIFAVVDQWDALNSDRPYRQAWSRDQVVAYMRANSGRNFDPCVLDAFLELVEAGQVACAGCREADGPDAVAADSPQLARSL